MYYTANHIPCHPSTIGLCVMTFFLRQGPTIPSIAVADGSIGYGVTPLLLHSATCNPAKTFLPLAILVLREPFSAVVLSFFSIFPVHLISSYSSSQLWLLDLPLSNYLSLP